MEQKKPVDLDFWITGTIFVLGAICFIVLIILTATGNIWIPD